MNDEQLRTFLLIAENGSFTKAEKDSWLSKQAMMKQMKSLEDELQVSLFERSHTVVKLSEKGKIFCKGAKKILKEEERLKESLKDTVSIVRIGNVEHQAVLDPVNSAFVKAHPEIPLQRVVHPNHSGEWRVANNIQDVAETFHLKNSPEADNTVYHRLLDVPYRIAVSLKHPLCRYRKVSLAQLTVYETMCYPIMMEEEYLKEVRQAFHVHPERLVERMDVDNQVSCAYECMNTDRILITANPFILSVEGLKLIPLDPGWTREYGILSRKDAGTAVQTYIDFAVSYYTEQKEN